MTDDEADFEILKLANEKRKFAISVGMQLVEPLQFALERGMDNEWFTLVDVTRIAHADSRVHRIFRLTDVGLARLAALKSTLAKTH